MNSQTTQPEVPAKKFWLSSNFWTAVVLAIAGLFVGFPTGDGEAAVTSLFALIAAAKGIREYFTELKPKPDVGQAVNRSNWWNYIGVIAVSIIPQIPLELIDSLQEVAINVAGNNWQGVLVGVFSIATIVYNVFRKSKPLAVEST